MLMAAMAPETSNDGVSTTFPNEFGAEEEAEALCRDRAKFTCCGTHSPVFAVALLMMIIPAASSDV
jgi:hypothetical protein